VDSTSLLDGSHRSDYEKYWVWSVTLCVPTEVRQRLEATYGIYLQGGGVSQALLPSDSSWLA
jgi:hypothetical protein